MKTLLKKLGVSYQELPALFMECLHVSAGQGTPELIERMIEGHSREGREVIEELYQHLHTTGLELTKQASETVDYMVRVNEDYSMSVPHVRLVGLIEKMGTEIDDYTRRICRNALWRQAYNNQTMDVATFWADSSGTPVSNPEFRKIQPGDIKPAHGRIVLVDAEDGSAQKPCLCVSDGILREGNRQEILIPVVDMVAFAVVGANAQITGAKFIGEAHSVIQAFFEVADELSAQGMLADADDIYGLKKRKKAAPRRQITAENNPQAKIDIGSWS